MISPGHGYSDAGEGGTRPARKTRRPVRLLITFLILGASLAQAALAGAGSDSGSPGAARMTLSLQNISCAACGQGVVAALREKEGVHKVDFDRNSAEVKVRYDSAKIGSAAILTVVHELGYEAVEGAGRGSYVPKVVFPEGMDIRWISRSGEEVVIEEHLAPGKVTVIDFYADWCGPCRQVDREMLAIMKNTRDVALRKVNVKDWSSPVARRYLAKVSGLPYLIVYSRQGKRVKAISGLNLDELRRAIEKGRKK